MNAGRHTVTIVGAGPGGLYAAMRLAQMGVAAIVLERAAFPRHKTCGDILTSNVLRSLHELDAGLVADLQTQPWAMELKATAFGSARSVGFVMPFHSPANVRMGLPSCLSARRIDFDAWLLEIAQGMGVEVRQECAVRRVQESGAGLRLETSQGDLHTDYLILAAGANSPLVRELVPEHAILPRHSAVGSQLYFRDAMPPDRPQLSEYYLFDRKFMPGGLYLTPFADGTVNVNAVMRMDTYLRTKPRLPLLMQEYLQAHPQLRDRFAHATVEGPASGATLFFGTKRRPLSRGRCLLVGDAAGITDATNANGIGHAMVSGGMAAEAIHLALKNGIEPLGYDEAIYLRLRNALRPGRLMRALFSNPLTTRFSVSLLNASLNHLNGSAVEEFVYSSNTTTTLLNPRFYWRLFAKQ